jgi:hypothetical protein
MIDTHKIFQRLQRVGFSTEQAEALNDALKEAVIGGDVATKRDIAESEARMTWRIATMLIAQVGVLFTLLKLFP